MASFTGILLMLSLALTGIAPANASISVAPVTAPAAGITTLVPVLVPASEQAYIAEFETLLNDHRATHGLKPLKFNGTAAAEALAWSQTMARGTFRHALPSEFYQPFTGLFLTRKENIAMSHIYDVSSMFTQWKASPSHNAAMLSPDVDSFGVGFYISKAGETMPNLLYGTAIFHRAKTTHLPDTFADSDAYFGSGTALPLTDNTEAKVSPKAVVVDVQAKKVTIPSTPGVIYVNNDTFGIMPAGTHDIYGIRTNISAIAQPATRSHPGQRQAGLFLTILKTGNGPTP